MLDKMKTGSRIGTRILTLALSLVLVLGTMVMFPNDSAKANIANHKLTVNFKNLDVDGNEISGPNKGGSVKVVYGAPDENPRDITFLASEEFEIPDGYYVEISCNQEYAGYKFKEIILDEDTGWQEDGGEYYTEEFARDTTATVIFQKQKNEISLKYEAPKCGTMVNNVFEENFSDGVDFVKQTPEPNLKYETPGCSKPGEGYNEVIPRLINSINEDYFDNENIFSGKLTAKENCYIYIPIFFDGDDFDIRTDIYGERWIFNGTVLVNGKPAEKVEYYDDYGDYGMLGVFAKAEIKHDWDTGRVTKEATCTEKGVKEFVCNGCNEKKTEEIAALGHDWDKGKITKKPTATKKGVKTFTCSRCSATRTESIPATGKKKSKAVVPTILKMTAKGKRAFAFSWNKAAGASGYEIYLSRCNTKKKSYTPKKVKTIKGNKKFSATIKGLKAKTPYKAYIRPYKMKKGKKTYLKKGPTMHALTSGSSRFYTNAKQIEMLKTSAKIKAGKSVKIKATVEKIKSGKKLMNSKHSPKLRYISTNKSVATVTKSGKVRAKAKGSCKIYIFTVNGVSKTFKVTVK